MTITDEDPFVRVLSPPTGSRLRSFVNAVRERDRRCVISGEVVELERDDWTYFQAAHIFPLAHESHWNECDFGRWITIVPATGDSINSVQNGMLLTANVHTLFDSYYLTINPDVSMVQ